MQDPERLLEQGSAFERALLEGGVAERPSATLTRRMAQGAGLAGALSYTSSAKALMQTWWGKTVALVGVGAGALGVIAVAASPSANPERDSSAAPSVVSSATPSSPAPELRVSESAQRDSEQEGASKPPGASKRIDALDKRSPSSPALESAAVSSKPAKPASTLAQEIKALDRVRGLVTQGDRARALVELDGYDRRYPEGTLRREARVLRARATQGP